jgi:hypothetical protein
MHADRRLIEALQQLARLSVATEKLKRDVAVAIARYEAACLLSRGPDPARALAWKVIAIRRDAGLRGMYHGLAGSPYLVG